MKSEDFFSSQLLSHRSIHGQDSIDANYLQTHHQPSGGKEKRSYFVISFSAPVKTKLTG